MYTLPIGTKITSPTTTYTITGVLGQGGFGITYSATCIVAIGAVKAKANVALKEHFVKADCVREDDTSRVSCSGPAQCRVELTRKDFIGEARRLKNIGGKSPNIVAVSEVFEANNTAYYAMEMIEGESLREYVASRGPLSEKEMLSIMTRIVEAVAFLHHNRITHLDIKPHNIMIASDDSGRLRPVLIDFGLPPPAEEAGEATSTINSRGFSDGYAPIEQYAGITRFSPASDVYSLAATMIFCLNAQSLPPAHEVTREVIEAALPANITPTLRSALIRALSLQAAKRHPDASALLDSLSEDHPHKAQHPIDEATVIDYQASTHRLSSQPIKQKANTKLKTKKKSNRGWIITLIGLVFLLIIGAAAYYISYTSTSKKSSSISEVAEMGSDIDDNYPYPFGLHDKVGYADKDGNIVIPCEYDGAGPFVNGFAKVMKDGKFGFINNEGKIVIPLIYDNAGDFKEGLAAVRIDDHAGYINQSGEIVIPLIYDDTREFSEGLAWVVKDGKWGFIDKTGQVVIPLIYGFTSHFNEGMSVVEKDRKYGYINKSGDVVIPFTYEWATQFSEGMAAVQKDGKWGYINNLGEIKIPLVYNYADTFREGVALVYRDGKYGYINKSGEIVVPLVYDYVGEFSEGLANVRKDEKYGYVNKSGEVVIPLIYESAGPFSEGMATVWLNDNWGYIDKSGKVVIPPIYSYSDDFYYGRAGVEYDGEFFYIDKSGNRINFK